MKNTFILILLSILFAHSHTLFSQVYPSMAEINEMIKGEVDNGRSSSIVIGIIDNGIESYASYGYPFEGRNDLANENTIFELASITKVYVSTILSDLVLKGKVNLDDLLVKYLSDTLEFINSNYYKITLEQLATHTSGIPTLLNELDTDKPDQYLLEMPYSELFAKIEQDRLIKEPGKIFQYSNINFALLSYVICKVTNENLEQLLKQYYFLPFNMNSSGFVINKDLEKSFVSSYIRPGVLAPSWNFSSRTFEGAGALKSSAKDQLIFLRKLFYENSEMTQAVENATNVFFDSTKINNTSMGLGWYIISSHGSRIFAHKGSSTGCRAVLAYDDLNNRGIVVLSNSSNDITDIFYYLLDKKNEITKFRKFENYELKTETFNQMKGKFMLKVGENKSPVEVSSRDGNYFINAYEIIYQGDNSFFVPKMNIIIEFTDLKNCKFQNIVIQKDKSKIGERID
jgi:serine-type D-Ala-D-Ala carboxypeptidase/endopeptidase